MLSDSNERRCRGITYLQLRSESRHPDARDALEYSSDADYYVKPFTLGPRAHYCPPRKSRDKLNALYSPAGPLILQDSFSLLSVGEHLTQ